MCVVFVVHVGCLVLLWLLCLLVHFWVYSFVMFVVCLCIRGVYFVMFVVVLGIWGV